MQVICEAGYSGCDHPKAFSWQGDLCLYRQINQRMARTGCQTLSGDRENSGHFELVFSETSGMLEHS